MKPTKIMLSLGLALTLSACGEKAVDTVKNSPLQDVDGVTTAELLEGRSLCTNPRWEEQETRDKDVPMVEFRCTLKGGKDFFAKEREAKVERSKQANRELVALQQRMADHETQKLEKARRDLALAKEAIDTPEKHPRIVELKEEIAGLQKEKQRLSEATLADFDKPKEEWGLLETVNRDAARYFQAKERVAAEPDNARLAKKLVRAERVLLHSLKQSAKVRDMHISSRQSTINSILPRASEDAKRSIGTLERQIIRLEESTHRQQERLAEMKARNAESLERLEASYDLASVDEVFRWKIIDGKANPIDAKVALVRKSGEQEEWRYKNPYRLPELIHRREVEEGSSDVDLDTYFQWRFAADQLSRRI